MHESSYAEMEKFVAGIGAPVAKIGDVGSLGFKNYRSLFLRPGWVYVGMDRRRGPNVDVVLPSDYEWKNVSDGAFDVVVSGQTLEHVPRPWLFMREMARIVKVGGVVCVVAPHTWAYHPSPLDCWRVYPEGLKATMQDAGLSIEKIYMNKTDTIGIAKKQVIS